MRLIDTDDPEQRRKAALHYERMARQAQRRIRRNTRWTDFAFVARFPMLDMILVALASAVLGMTIAVVMR